MRSVLNTAKVSNDYISKEDSANAERHLLARVASGQQEAFTELYDRLSTPLFNYILRLVFDPHIAEELLQETFVAIWKGAKNFRGRSKVSTWAFQIAHNQTVSWLRKYKNKHRRLIDAPLNEGIYSTGVSPEDASVQSAERRDLVSALHSLPQNQRAVVALFYIQGMSYKEISVIVKSPLGTVKSRLRMGLQKLRHTLKKQDH